MSVVGVNCDRCDHAFVVKRPPEEQKGKPELWECRCNPPVPVALRFNMIPCVFDALSLSPESGQLRGYELTLRKLDWVYVTIGPTTPVCSHFVSREKQ